MKNQQCDCCRDKYARLSEKYMLLLEELSTYQNFVDDIYSVLFETKDDLFIMLLSEEEIRSQIKEKLNSILEEINHGRG